ncbi:cytochrome-c oxidase, cbb3-type subunit II [Hyphobacterium sp. HN65]|uniref:Cytochrome-c oxidase, cbb3-type subunit II n=1 Tax=Hyphobacterium lacteum TaxID=3116575 RepID=A0ABU7LRI8_9PROT|nr:cytochrome-c oxidase, cbb3-type subunit II [Hyphobacterium sp. HN65]MEE2526521.1 cytochrome-c oxidase, cbb3-type subunit II [Hyphobacterium sp. HN65]
MADTNTKPTLHQKLFEKNSLILTLGIILTVSVGGVIEIAPLFYLNSTIEEVDGVRPYTPLELMGRQIYLREGCYNCHSQMIRPLRDEVERYGHYSLAAESMYDRPFQWGSKRTGPDLARVGGRYSDEWHRDHLINPQSVVPESIMPPYAFLADAALDYSNIQAHLRVNQFLGVPYSDEAVESARTDLEAQLDEFSSGYDDLVARYPGVQVRDFDGNAGEITEMDALIAYLQVLGTMVDFSTYEPEAAENQR